MKVISKALKHYVGNQLQTIMGYFDLAAIVETQAEQDKYLARAKAAVRQLEAALNDGIVPSIKKEP